MAKIAANDCNLFFFDCETGGLDPVVCDMVEVACVVVDPTGENIIGEYTAKVFPRLAVNARAAELNGYTKEVWEKEAVPLQTAMTEMLGLAGNAIFAAHNAPFDWGFFEKAMKRYDLRWRGDYHKIDTVALSWPLFINNIVPNLKLVTMRDHFNIETGKAHRALADVHACYQLYRKLMCMYNPVFKKPEFKEQVNTGVDS